MKVEKLINWHETNKCKSIAGRYITTKSIDPVLAHLPTSFKQRVVGESAEGRKLKTIEVGSGSIRILCWSQMHGNESTGTKALIDLLEWLSAASTEAQEILDACTMVFMPIVNPDGAVAYSRVNAQQIDLNRDVLDQNAPESKVLLSVLKEVNPEYCFNLHDQRTIFSVEPAHHPATLSFLAPSVNQNRTVTEGRKKTMQVIAAIYQNLRKVLPHQIGRYSDEFYPTATGDNFEKMGHHTILIEAGHFPDDYQREVVRKYNWLALLLGIHAIAKPSKDISYKSYFEIPNNEQYYLDEIHYNVKLENYEELIDLGILYKEILTDGTIRFLPQIEKIGHLTNYTANKLINSKGKTYKDEKDFLNNYKK
ncbi:zinc carboxypeptidase [Flavobacteriaceae bacterium F08102]|nr:zinc carboxypeptidase [Flavobacteriaceae bacterium F08102]